MNEPGVWMVQSFFKLEAKDTLAACAVMETVLSATGMGTSLLAEALR